MNPQERLIKELQNTVYRYLAIYNFVKNQMISRAHNLDIAGRRATRDAGKGWWPGTWSMTMNVAVGDELWQKQPPRLKAPVAI